MKPVILRIWAATQQAFPRFSTVTVRESVIFSPIATMETFVVNDPDDRACPRWMSPRKREHFRCVRHGGRVPRFEDPLDTRDSRLEYGDLV